jgi:hypothetical protein
MNLQDAESAEYQVDSQEGPETNGQGEGEVQEVQEELDQEENCQDRDDLQDLLDSHLAS